MRSACAGIFILCLLFTSAVVGQGKYFTKNGKISFFSKAPMENIEASNKTVTCVLDSKTGNVQFAVLMKGFQFRKARMQEDFNENYIESDKYPKSEFKGQIVNNSDISYDRDGSYNAKVKGMLTIHGETKDVETEGKILVKGGKVATATSFNILLSDYKIRIPRLVTEKVSNNIRINVNCSLEPLKG